jgi:hypothetical protein
LFLLSILLSIAALSSAAAVPPTQPAAPFAALWAYNGTWKITKKDAGSPKPYELMNKCAAFGKYFACQQSVNGTPTELTVFVATNSPGQYYTQSILSDGRAGGRGDLKIEGDKWTFSTSWNQGGRSTFYKTINTFMSKSQIHFEQQESTDNKDWKTTGSGDQVRTSAGAMTVVR